MELEKIKKEYEKFLKKYKLPDFNALNEEFEIEKLERESETILRAVRKVMMEKIVNSLGFLEMLLTPMNAPRMYFAYIKTMSSGDKQKIEKMYSLLSDMSLIALEREIEYSEKGEAELINSLFKGWNEIKRDFVKIVENIKKPNNQIAKKEKSYFE